MQTYWWCKKFNTFLVSASFELTWQMLSWTVPATAWISFFRISKTSLFKAHARSALESIVLKPATIMALLLLQMTYRNTKSEDFVWWLERRLHNWQKGKIQDLLFARRIIQEWLHESVFKQFDDPKLLKAFAKLMMEVKTKAALLLITQQDRGSIRHINNIIHSELSTPYKVLDTLKINNLQVNLLINRLKVHHLFPSASCYSIVLILVLFIKWSYRHLERLIIPALMSMAKENVYLFSDELYKLT